MYSEKTEIVDVVAITENNSTTYSLSKKAGDLFEAAKAGTVIRRHDVNETGNPDYKDYAYVGLSKVKLNGSGYSFKFASGDEFTASDADAYPSASSVSDAIAGGSAAEDEPLIGEKTVFSGVLGAYESLVPFGKACRLPDGWAAVSASLTDDELATIIVYVDGSTGDVSSPYMLSFDEQHVANTAASDVGKPVEIKIPAISPALINLYDPDSSDTETYYPDGAYDSDNEVFVLDVSTAYERLKRGQNVWIRWWSEGGVVVAQVIGYNIEDDTLYCASWYGENAWAFTNYTGSSPEINPQPDPGE